MLGSILMYNGYIDVTLILITIVVVWLIFRAMTRAETDTMFSNMYKGKERRNARDN
jgi:hypothetical protein